MDPKPQGEPEEYSDPTLFLNRELSLLEFNRRVLAQALDEATPLLERLRFLTICSTNLDEFFEIRVSGHRERAAIGTTKLGADGMTPSEVLAAISRSAHELVAEQYRALNDVLLPALEAENLRLVRRQEWSDEVRKWARDYFERHVLPVLTPVGLDPAHPFPKVVNKSLNFVVLVEGDDAYGRTTDIAVVHVPRALPRVINIPRKIGRGRHDYVMLSSVIHEFIDEAFPGMVATGCYQFRVTRNGDLWVDEEEAEDFLKAIEVELPERKYSAAVRLEIARDCPDEVARFLLDKFELNLHRLQALHSQVDRPDLKYRSFTPRIPRRAERGESIFDAISRSDILLHHPYESFAPVLEFLRQAATDPDVLAIKQTLYRVGENSPIVDALIEAARAGKEVTVVVELRARFDEAENIDLATRLQDVGANVVYGVVGYKTHAKMALVVRREGNRTRRYVHLGTGNYHAGTARAYTDLGFLTVNPEMSRDVHRLFMQLTGLGQAVELDKILQSPFTLRSTMLRLIDEEAERARAGEPAYILARMNALTMRSIVEALYRASSAGVKVDLLVRSACCLRPGIAGVSENIRVRSIVGRFLEHSRVFYFHAGGKELVYASSADWMTRNLVRRVETCFPIEDYEIKRRVVRECLEDYLLDNQQAWELGPDGLYTRVVSSNGATYCAQAALLERIASENFEADSERGDEGGLSLEVGSRKRVGGNPRRRKDKSKNGSRQSKRRDRR